MGVRIGPRSRHSDLLAILVVVICGSHYPQEQKILVLHSLPGVQEVRSPEFYPMAVMEFYVISQI